MPRSYLHDVQSSDAKPAVVQPTVMSNVRPPDTSLLPNLPLSVGPDACPAQASFRNTESCEEPWIRKKALGFPDSCEDIFGAAHGNFCMCFGKTHMHCS